MKKIFSTILSLIILSSPFLLVQKGYCANKKNISSATSLAIKEEPQEQQTQELGVFVVPLVEDEFVKKIENNNLLQITEYQEELLEDEQILTHDDTLLTKAAIKKNKLETEQGHRVSITPIKKIKTKNSYVKIQQGKKIKKYRITLPSYHEKIVFRVNQDVISDGKTVINKDSIVYGHIGELSSKAMGGAPAEIVLENFELLQPDGSIIPLNGSISADGYSLSFWVGLAELATTPLLVGLAVPLLRVLPGGQAVITPRKNYTIYYQEN